MDEPRLKREQRILFTILPEVVWLLIVQKLLKFPNTATSIYNASACLQQLLRSMRNTFFFARLLDKSVTDFGMTNPKIRLDHGNLQCGTPFTMPVLLKLRLVSKWWCEALETLMRYRSTLCLTMAVTKICTQEGRDEDTRFLTHFAKSHSLKDLQKRSPFIGNRVTLEWRNLHPQNAVNRGYMPFIKILGRFGQHVQICQLTLTQIDAPENWYNATTFQILRRMPNLRMMTLSLHRLVNGNPTDLRNWLSRLPTYVHLEHLYFDADLSHEFATSLVSKFPNLKILRTNLNTSLEHPQDLFPGASLQMLEDLSLHLNGGIQNNFPDRDRHPPLQGYNCLANVGLHNIFRTLEAHSPLQHLTRLCLDLPCALTSTWNEWHQYKINLPTLQALNLRFTDWSCIDFVMAFCSALEILHINISASESLDQWRNGQGANHLILAEYIKFLSRNGNLDTESNIWTLIPRLQSAVVMISVAGQQSTVNAWGRYENILRCGDAMHF